MTRRFQVPVLAALVALLLAWKVNPFRSGEALAAHGTGLAFWVSLGLLVGVAVSTRSASPLREALVPRDLLLPGAGGFVIAGFLPHALSVALALVALGLLVTELIGRGPLLLGVATGALLGSLGGRTFALVAAAVCLAGYVLLVRRKVPPAAAVLAVVALSVLWPSLPRALADDSVKVGGSSGFVSAHRKVAAGEVIHVRATGRVTFLKGVQADPNGYPARYTGCDGPGLCGSLIGRVGDAGTAFALGSGGVVTSPAAGELQLSVNDYDAKDNSGSFSVTVWTTPAGTAPTVRLRPAGIIDVPSGTTGLLRTAFVAALCTGMGVVGGQLLSTRRRQQAES